MFLLRGNAVDLRQGWSRRDCLRVGLGGTLGLLGPALRAGEKRAEPSRRSSFGQAKACILIYLFGGPSHLDIWDMKPDGPDAGVRGEFKPQVTNVPGVSITEHLPRLAQHADKYAVISSLTQYRGDNNHGSSGHAMLTGRPPRSFGEVGPNADDFPQYGAVLSRLRPARNGVPPFVALPQAVSTSTNIVPGQNGGFLGRAMDPFRLEHHGNQQLNFAPPLTELPADVNKERLRGRSRLIEQIESQGTLAHNQAADEMRQLYRRALTFMDSPEAARAFRLENEPARLRERYGMNVFGQSLLLARRLVEAGVSMITVYWPDRKDPAAFNNAGKIESIPVPPWDTHGRNVGSTPNFPFLKDRLLPVLDVASTALLEDLTARGLLDQTLVVWTGEFGRTPKVNDQAGRDHYGNVFSAMLGGGGIRAGQVYGSSDRKGAFPANHPVTPADFAATIYHCLGVAPGDDVPDRLGRPVHVSDGKPIATLV